MTRDYLDDLQEMEDEGPDPGFTQNSEGDAAREVRLLRYFLIGAAVVILVWIFIVTPMAKDSCLEQGNEWKGGITLECEEDFNF